MADTPLTDMTPVEIDTALADLDAKLWKVYGRTTSCLNDVHYAAKDRRHGRLQHWGMSHNDAEAAVRTLAETADTAYTAYTRTHAANTLSRLDELRAETASIKSEMRTYDAEYVRRGGWGRAFLAITNGKGHVHRSMDCSTCNNGENLTQFNWMINWSGATEEKIVEDAGDRACTVCYASAPAEKRLLPTKMFSQEEIEQQAAREKRARAKTEREAKKAAKAIFNPDGTPLQVFDYRVAERNVRGKLVPAHDTYETIETLHAARGWLTDSQEDWRSPERAEDVQRVAAAIAHKEGKTPEQAIEEAKTRAKKRR